MVGFLQDSPPAFPLHFIHMKRIYSMGKNKYVHMDSYNESHETGPVFKFFLTLFVFGIAAMTAGAVVGIDVTSPFSPITHGYQNRTCR
jgi:hypothetical protein